MGGAVRRHMCRTINCNPVGFFFFLACWKDLDAGAHCKSNRPALSPNSYVNSQSTRLICQRLKVNSVKGGWFMIMKKTYASLQGLVSLYSFCLFFTCRLLLNWLCHNDTPVEDSACFNLRCVLKLTTIPHTVETSLINWYRTVHCTGKCRPAVAAKDEDSFLTTTVQNVKSSY